MDEFDKFVTKEEESLESVYERLTTLVNILDLVDYDDEYQGELQGDSQENKLITAMMLLAQAITKKFSTPTNNRLCISSNTRNQAVVQDGLVDIQTKNACYRGNANKNAGRENMNQVFNARNGSAESNQIVQPDDNAENVSSYDAKAISENPERLKKAIATQPKLYNGDSLHSANLIIDSPDSKETLEDAEENRLKMRNKMVQINYSKLNALYETFVPQQEFSAEQTYFSIPSTSNNGYESKKVTSELPILKTPK
nr:hypothetical protein [Tanacetum cinerariifolium]GEY52700.1 hypothetical protein [Tanacetum cinerariifolium]